MRRSLLPCLLGLASLVAAAPPAHAQDPQQIAQAKKWFKEGEDAEKAQDWATALARFQMALTVKETPQLLLRVGATQEKLGQLKGALESYKKGLDKATAANLAPVAKLARDQIDGLTPRIPGVTVKVAKPPPGLSVELDGKPVASTTFGTKIDLDPGDHRLVAHAPGFATLDKPFKAAEKDAIDLPIDLAPAAPADDAGKEAGPSKLTPVLFLAGGAAAIGAGVVLFVVSKGNDAQIDKQCGGADRLECPLSQKAKITSEVGTVNALQAFAIISGGLGLASAGVGSYLLIKKPKDDKPQQAVELAPVFGPSDAGLVVRGRF
jgi:hypothetical protein